MAKAVVLDQLAAASPAARAFLLLFFPLLLLLVLLRYFAARRTGARSRQLPPSPPALPLIGHAHLVGALPHVSLRDLAARHGGADGFMALRLGTVPTLVASSPRAAQLVLRTHDQSFASRPPSVCGDVLMYGPADVAMVPYGELWRQSKKLVTTHLLSAKKVQSYRAAREEEVELVINQIRDAAATGAVVNMSEVLTKFMNDMVCRAVAGRSFRVEGRDKVFRELINIGVILLGGLNLDNFYPSLAKMAGGLLMAVGLAIAPWSPSSSHPRRPVTPLGRALSPLPPSPLSLRRAPSPLPPSHPLIQHRHRTLPVALPGSRATAPPSPSDYAEEVLLDAVSSICGRARG